MMRTNPLPKYGDLETVTQFCWVPFRFIRRTFERDFEEWYWLERITITRQYVKGMPCSFWKVLDVVLEPRG